MKPLLRLFERWLALAARRTLERERPYVITVSGTVGKSSTKQAISAVLHADETLTRTRVSAKNYNNELGVPLTVFGLPAPGRSIGAWLTLLSRAFFTSIGLTNTNIQTFVFELGVDKPGDMKNLTTFVTPDLIVLTALTPEDSSLAPSHTSNFGSIDALVEEESLIVNALRSQGTLVLNADDARVYALRLGTNAHVLTFGFADYADVQLTEATVRTEEGAYGSIPVGLEISFQVFQRPYIIYLPGVFGRSIAYAVCAAVAVATALDIPMDQVCETFPEYFKGLPGRTRIIPGVKYTTLFDDTYNASPIATISSIRDLGRLTLKPEQRRIACIGEMRELGEQAEALHREVGAEAARNKVDLFVACGLYAQAMKEGAIEHGLSTENIQLFDDVPEAGRFIQRYIRPGDVVLAKASEGQSNSRGARMERVIKELMAEPNRAHELIARQDSAWRRYR